MATDKQTRALTIYVENRGKSVSAAMREAGYSDQTAKNPKNLTDSQAWRDLIDEKLKDEDLVDAHHRLLSAQEIGHMVFPLGMDEVDIKELLNSVGCTPQKVKHGESAIHVWYWSPDYGTQKAAVELAYKLKGRLTQKIEVQDPGGIFGTDALKVTVIDGRADAESETETGA